MAFFLGNPSNGVEPRFSEKPWEIRSGKVIGGCICVKRNGLQSECLRSECVKKVQEPLQASIPASPRQQLSSCPQKMTSHSPTPTGSYSPRDPSQHQGANAEAPPPAEPICNTNQVQCHADQNPAQSTPNSVRPSPNYSTQHDTQDSIQQQQYAQQQQQYAQQQQQYAKQQQQYAQPQQQYAQQQQQIDQQQHYTQQQQQYLQQEPIFAQNQTQYTKNMYGQNQTLYDRSDEYEYEFQGYPAQVVRKPKRRYPPHMPQYIPKEMETPQSTPPYFISQMEQRRELAAQVSPRPTAEGSSQEYPNPASFTQDKLCRVRQSSPDRYAQQNPTSQNLFAPNPTPHPAAGLQSPYSSPADLQGITNPIPEVQSPREHLQNAGDASNSPRDPKPVSEPEAEVCKPQRHCGLQDDDFVMPTEPLQYPPQVDKADKLRQHPSLSGKVEQGQGEVCPNEVQKTSPEQKTATEPEPHVFNEEVLASG